MSPYTTNVAHVPAADQALDGAAAALLEHQLRAGWLSARGLHRVRRVARTLADLAGGGRFLAEEHVCLALGLRASPLETEEAA